MNKQTLIFLFLILGLVSCDFVNNVEPDSQLTVDNFITNSEDAITAVNGAYAAMQLGGQYNEAFYKLYEIRSDNASEQTSGSVRTEVNIDQFLVTPTNVLVEDAWRDLYAGVQRSNVVINRIQDIDIDQDLSDRLTGEAKFLRGLFYFHLVRLYGGVPIILDETTSPMKSLETGRSSVEETYQQIETDLQDAEDSLPTNYSGSNIGRATQGAAKAILAKVYLTQKKYDLSLEKIQEVRDLNTYGLVDNYANLFDPANENNKESIFDVQYRKGGMGTGSPFTNDFAPEFSGDNVVSVGSGSGQIVPEEDIINEFDTSDLRKDITVQPGYTDKEGDFIERRYINKYLQDTPFQAGDSDINWPVIRFADILLMHAEVLNEINNGPTVEAYTAVNLVRERADVAPLEPELSKEAFLQAVLKERRLELAFENHRWNDLVRTGKAVEVMSAKGFNLDETNLIYPIPQSQIDVNPGLLEQNPGY